MSCIYFCSIPHFYPSYLDGFRDGRSVAVQLLYLFNIACSILVQFPSWFFFIHLVNVHVVHPCSRIDATATWKKLRFILSDRSDFHIIDNLSIAVHVFVSRILMSFWVGEMLLPRSQISTLCLFTDLSDKIKWDFFQTVAVSILVYGC